MAIYAKVEGSIPFVSNGLGPFHFFWHWTCAAAIATWATPRQFGNRFAIRFGWTVSTVPAGQAYSVAPRFRRSSTTSVWPLSSATLKGVSSLAPKRALAFRSALASSSSSTI